MSEMCVHEIYVTGSELPILLVPLVLSNGGVMAERMDHSQDVFFPFQLVYYISCLSGQVRN
jgi:hypothetical protein